jgi:hypothetical protein
MRAREVGESVYGDDRLSPAIAGLDTFFNRFPGACAPGFMLTPAIAGLDTFFNRFPGACAPGFI